jgi:hypothetical protein
MVFFFFKITKSNHVLELWRKNIKKAFYDTVFLENMSIWEQKCSKLFSTFNFLDTNLIVTFFKN